MANYFRLICCTVRKLRPTNVIRIKQFIASEVFKMEMEEQQRQEQQEVEEYGESELEDDVFE